MEKWKVHLNILSTFIEAFGKILHQQSHEVCVAQPMSQNIYIHFKLLENIFFCFFAVSRLSYIQKSYTIRVKTNILDRFAMFKGQNHH